MSDGSLRWLSAEDIGQLGRRNKLDPQDVVKAHLAAIDRFDSRIHAFIYVDRQAKSTPGPYAGVTLAVKDSQPVAGMPYTYGTPSWRDRIADEDAVPVARARSWGMAILGKTNLPELAASIGTTNTLFPPTQNPWRQGITPGGSSGGSAAAVAAGMTTLALGGDTGGSIRIPASCCGVVGLRPTPDLVPSEEVDVTVLQSRGPITRTVADARLLLGVMTATQTKWSGDERKPKLVGVATTSSIGADPACEEACRRAASALQKAGHIVEEIKWDPEPVTQGYGTVRRASMASFPADLSTFGPGIQKLAAEGRGLTAMDYFRAFELATNAANRVVGVPLQTRYDFLLTPTLGLLPMPIEKVPAFLGEDWARYVQFVLPVSFARTPAISIPAGLHDGLPVGVQLVGKFAQESELLTFAEELEKMPGFGFQRPPDMEVDD
ncbi:MAG TPA: amidase [Candidatus Sulfotelmatobacter sp.]|nr:amidase [Candidatus Sulfotelmatobacter sp.]